MPYSKYRQNDQIKGDEMGGACSTLRRQEKTYNILTGNLELKRKLGTTRQKL
jgi:hypothetical protein